MKKFILFLFLFYVAVCSYAQDYFPFDRAHRSTFAYCDSLNNYNIQAFYIAKADTLNGDSVYYMNDHVENDEQCHPFEQGVFRTDSNNAFIYKVIKKMDGEYNLYERNGNILNYNTNWLPNVKYNTKIYIGQTSSYYQIALAGKSYELINGVYDSVVFFDFYNNNIKQQSQLKVYKNFGIKKFPFYFKKNNFQIDFSIPKYKDIYDYQVGDELQYEWKVTAGTWGYYLLKCKSLIIDTVKDIGYYYFDKSWFGFKYNPNPTPHADSSNGFTTDSLIIKNYSQLIYKSLPNEACYKDTAKKNVQMYYANRQPNFNNATAIHIGGEGFAFDSADYLKVCAYLLPNQRQNRFWTAIDGSTPSYTTHDTTLVFGVGLTKEVTRYIYNFTNVTTATTTLRYYKIGNKTYGTKYTGITDPIFDSNPISIYPNPCNDYITLSNPNHSLFKTEMYSIDGKLLKQIPQSSSDKITLDVSDLSRGVYLLRVINNNGVSTNRVVVER